MEEVPEAGGHSFTTIHEGIKRSYWC